MDCDVKCDNNDGTGSDGKGDKAGHRVDEEGPGVDDDDDDAAAADDDDDYEDDTSLDDDPHNALYAHEDHGTGTFFSDCPASVTGGVQSKVCIVWCNVVQFCVV